MRDGSKDTQWALLYTSFEIKAGDTNQSNSFDCCYGRWVRAVRGYSSERFGGAMHR
jgi:hypothetical protein